MTNCGKNNLASWFTEIGGYSGLCVDVNHAAQMRQGVPLPSTHLFPATAGGGGGGGGRREVACWSGYETMRSMTCACLAALCGIIHI